MWPSDVPRISGLRKAGQTGNDARHARRGPQPWRVRLSIFFLAAFTLPGAIPVLGGGAALAAGEPVIESIEVVGNHRLTTDAFIFATGLKVGDPYSEDAVKKAFHRLWDKDLFNDIKVEAETSEHGGKIVRFTVEERPILVSVDYDTVSAITRSNIEDAFKQRGLDLAVGKPVNEKSLWKGTEYIKDLLGNKGYLDPTVTYTLTSISTASRAVRFNIKQGPRTRIRKITFEGNQVFSSRKLRATLKQVKESSLLAHIGGKDLWRPALYDQDVQKIFELYRSEGYLDVEIKPPVVEVREKNKAKTEEEQKKAAEKALEKAQKEARKKKRPPKPGALPAAAKEPKIKRSVYLTVKVKEGPQYKTGTISVKGNTVFTEPQVLAHIPLRTGMILNDSALQAGLDRLRASYGSRGYIYAVATKSVVRKEGNIADVTIDISEDQAYKVGAIEFEGNTVTRDFVLRREMRLNEGELLNRPRLDVSGYKIEQLGFVRPNPDPAIEPLEGTNQAMVRIKLEEQGRNEIQVGGGYSGLDGFFFSGSYSTRNFLGRGEVLSAYLQVGGSSNRYQLAFVEPWFMGKPYQLGASVFKRDTNYASNQTRSGAGGTLSLGRSIGNFSQANLLYAYENVLFVDSTPTVGANLARSRTTIASLTPSFNFNKVDNPFRPTRGNSLNISSQVAGETLGGDNSFWKPLVQYSQYIPFVRRTFFGIHLESGFVLPYGNGTTTGAAIREIPQFERFFVGGDQIGPRIFETRSIGPIEFVTRDGSEITTRKRDIVRFKGRDVFGQPIQVFCDLRYDQTPGDGLCNSLVSTNIGGNRYALGQFEYAVSVAQPFVLAFFVDVGNAIAENQDFTFSDFRVSSGIEARIYLPVFQAPLRFIVGTAVKDKPGDRTNSFQFSIGTSF